MDYDREQTSTQRHYFLSTLLALLAASGIFVFLVAVTGGFFLYVLAAVVAMAAFGYLHYLLWGRSMTHQVEAEERGRAKADDWEQADPSRNGWR
jgi:hypothetical protein